MWQAWSGRRTAGPKPIRHSTIGVAFLQETVSTWRGQWTMYGDQTLEGSLRLDGRAALGRAADLGRIGARRLGAGDVVRAEQALPRYVGATGARPNRAGIADGRVLVR